MFDYIVASATLFQGVYLFLWHGDGDRFIKSIASEKNTKRNIKPFWKISLSLYLAKMWLKNRWVSEVSFHGLSLFIKEKGYYV